MSPARKGLALAAAAALAACGGSESGTGAAAPKRAANFELEALSGETVRLSDHQGKVILLDFWATYCVPCHESIPFFQKLYKEFGPNDFTVIGVSVDAYKEFVPEYAKENGMNYPVLLDPSRAALKAYGAGSLPTTFLLDREAKIVREWRGFDPMIAEEIRTLVRDTLHPGKSGTS